jgi:hypothetical protein
MHTIPNLRPALQIKNDENRANSRHYQRKRRRVTRSFVPLPKGYMQSIPGCYQDVFLVLWELGHGQPVRVENRVIAARVKRGISTVRRKVAALVALGKLGRKVNRISWCRNDSNLYSFPELEGFIVAIKPLENERELPVQNLNTSTTAPREGAGGSYARERWEHHHRRNHPPAMRRLHEHNAALQAEVRTLRHGRMACRGSSGLSQGDLAASERDRIRAEEADRRQAEAFDFVLKKWGLKGDVQDGL